MKVTTEHLKDILNLERYDYHDVIGASPYSLDEFESKNREQDLVMWRSCLVSVAKIQGFTYAKAGSIVYQDHATVIHSMKSIFNRVPDKQFPEYRQMILDIKRHIEMNLSATDDICLNEINCIIMLDNLIGKKFLKLN